MNRRDINVYRGDHGGWTVEVLGISGWYVRGVYGTREAALRVVSRVVDHAADETHDAARG